MGPKTAESRIIEEQKTATNQNVILKKGKKCEERKSVIDPGRNRVKRVSSLLSDYGCKKGTESGNSKARENSRSISK